MLWSAACAVAALATYGVLSGLGVDALPWIRVGLPHRAGQFFVVAGVLAPITEELFFRGIVYGFFRRWGFIIALLISTVSFVWAHAVNSSIPIVQIVGGIIFALAYEKSGTIITSMIIHSTGNLALFGISWWMGR